jgi:hypothetical protein
LDYLFLHLHFFHLQTRLVMNIYQQLLSDLGRDDLRYPHLSPHLEHIDLFEQPNSNGKPFTSPATFDMKGKPLLLDHWKELQEQIDVKPTAPCIMPRSQWDRMNSDLKEELTMVESPNLPEGTVFVRPQQNETDLKFSPLEWRHDGMQMKEVQDEFTDRICGAFGVPSTAMNTTPWASSELLYRASSPVLSRPQPICLLECPAEKPISTAPRFSAQELQRIEKFLYWCGREQGLRRKSYFERLALEGKSVCCHDATGEDRRYARWRLAFHESTKLGQEIHLSLQ